VSGRPNRRAKKSNLPLKISDDSYFCSFPQNAISPLHMTRITLLHKQPFITGHFVHHRTLKQALHPAIAK